MQVLSSYFGVVTGSELAQTKAQKPARANNEVYMLDFRREIKAPMSRELRCRRQFQRLRRRKHERGDGIEYNAGHLHKPGAWQHPELGVCMVGMRPWLQPNRSHLMTQSNAFSAPFATQAQMSLDGQTWAPFNRGLFAADIAAT